MAYRGFAEEVELFRQIRGPYRIERSSLLRLVDKPLFTLYTSPSAGRNNEPALGDAGESDVSIPGTDPQSSIHFSPRRANPDDCGRKFDFPSAAEALRLTWADPLAEQPSTNGDFVIKSGKATV